MTRIALQYYPRALWAFLHSLVALAASGAAGQSNAGLQVGDDTLEYYLVQAFEAPRAEQRIALNHIGIEVRAEENGFLVTAALEGYPAHQVGIERGDKILRVDGKPYHPIYSFNALDVQPASIAPSTSTRSIEFERMGALQTVEIASVFENLYDSYRSATLNSAQAFPLGNKTIGYIRFWGLSRSTSDLFALDLLMRNFPDSDGMILDLRNAYGYLSSEHLDLFVRDGRGYFESSGPSNRHPAIGQGIPSSARPFTKPIVVLVNSRTRGGAELFAYGLSKLERITTLGEASEGRIGSYTQQEKMMLYLPATETRIDGQRFEGVGVSPQEVVPFPFTQPGRSDPQFESAVDFLLGRI